MYTTSISNDLVVSFKGNQYEEDTAERREEKQTGGGARVLALARAPEHTASSSTAMNDRMSRHRTASLKPATRAFVPMWCRARFRNFRNECAPKMMTNMLRNGVSYVFCKYTVWR